MNILLLDIETSPNSAFVWGLWDQNIGLNQLIQSSEILCYAAKWLSDPVLMFNSKFHCSRSEMLDGLWNLLNAADVVVHYNGNKFDIPVVHREFLVGGLGPPSPSKSIDLYQVTRRKFRFLSNKLDYVAQELGLGKKDKTDFTLWVNCMNNDPNAWKLMEKYNKQDVILLEKLYEKLKPWITNHPNMGAFTGTADTCPNCGSLELQRRGFAITTTRKYQRYVCKSCGHWSRSTMAEKRTNSNITHAI